MITNQALHALVDIVLEKARNAPADEAIRARGDLHAAIDAALGAKIPPAPDLREELRCVAGDLNSIRARIEGKLWPNSGTAAP